MSVQQFNQTSYGLSQALINEFPTPIISIRNPTVNDKAKIGTLWVNTVANGTFIITSVINNQATWITAATGGDFTSITVDPGDITLTDGNLNVDLGSIDVGAGNITISTGNLDVTLGSGDFGGSLNADTTITAGTGLTVATGDVTVVTGDLIVTAGSITCGNGLTVTDSPLTVSNAGIQAHGEVVASSDIISTGGSVYGLSLVADGDIGSGFAGNTAITNVFDTTQSTGALTLKSTTANPGSNTGFLKIYVGTDVAYVPYFLNIAP